jgi:SAM-dependent methyltransferase
MDNHSIPYARAFDQEAASYDQMFSHTVGGRLQRERVWQYLETVVRPGMRVLELGCGSGEDTRWFAEHGCDVTALDVSPEMVKVARQKCAEYRHVTVRQFDVTHLSLLQGRYDLIFSNFGVMNCLAPTEFVQHLTATPKLLTSTGSILHVLMPDRCWMESLYFLIKRDWSRVFRRRRRQVAVVGAVSIPVWYYSPSVVRAANEALKVRAVLPIGVVLPPSYLASLVERRPRLASTLAWVEHLLAKSSAFARYSDHYLVHLEHAAPAP